MKLRITPLFPVKRFAAMAAACVMLVSVAACGSKSDSGATVNPGEAIIPSTTPSRRARWFPPTPTKWVAARSSVTCLRVWSAMT